MSSAIHHNTVHIVTFFAMTKILSRFLLQVHVTLLWFQSLFNYWAHEWLLGDHKLKAQINVIDFSVWIAMLHSEGLQSQRQNRCIEYIPVFMSLLQKQSTVLKSKIPTLQGNLSLKSGCEGSFSSLVLKMIRPPVYCGVVKNVFINRLAGTVEWS